MPTANECGAPNPGTEMRCQREAGHKNECESKYKMLYPNGIVSWGEMTWAGPNNLPRKEADDVQQLQR